MPEPQRSPRSAPKKTHQDSGDARYRISRKGSVYNILGPDGRIFAKYKSASVVGPRWEELTHTPWPYESSAYESGLRLWELGLIERRQVGQRRPSLDAAPVDAPPPREPDPVPEPEPEPEPPAQDKPAPDPAPQAAVIGAQLELLSVRAPEPAPPEPEANDPPAPDDPPRERPQAYRVIQPDAPPVVRTAPLPLGLPAPRIDLDQQRAMIDSLRKDPSRLFEPDMRRTLQTEIEYHLPLAAWAAYLLRLLDRYERRQRRQSARRTDWQTIMHKHIAWQEQRQQAAAHV